MMGNKSRMEEILVFLSDFPATVAGEIMEDGGRFEGLVVA